MITPLAALDAAPEFARIAFNRTRRPKAQDRSPVVELDLPNAVDRAIDYLKHRAPEASPGNRNDTAYRVAAQIRHFGISETQCFALMSEHWESASIMDSVDELMGCVEHAFRYATGGWGGMSGLSEFDDVTALLAKPTEVSRRGLYRVSFKDAVQRAVLQLADPLIDGIFDQQTFVVVYGASNAGKTFVVLDFAFHIATGRPWQGRETSRGLVVYVAAEGSRGVYKRMAALAKHYAVDDASLDLVPCPINLLNSKADINALLALINEAAAEQNQPVRMIVIDTLSRALAGGDENTSTDMGAFVKNIDAIRAATKATVCVVHHTGKDAAKGARGWSGLRAAIDTEIEVADNAIKIAKQRDLEPVPDIGFRLDRVEIGNDPKGRVITTCAVRIVTGNEFVKIEPNAVEAEMLEAFEIAAREQNPDIWQEATITTEEWDSAFLSQFEGESHQPPAYRHRTRLRTRLAAMGHVRKVQKGQWVIVP